MLSLIGKATALAAVGGKATALVAVGATPKQRESDMEPALTPIPVETPPVAERAQMQADELDSVGRDNELIRNRCIDIVNKVQAFSSIGDDLTSVFGQVDQIMRELEETKAELIQRIAIFNVERDGHSELKARYNALHDENEAHKSDSQMLRSEGDRLKETVRALEARIETLENEALENSTQIAVGDVQRQELEAHVAYLTSELQASQQSVREADALISNLQTELSAANDQNAMRSHNENSLQIALADAQQTAARFKTDFEDANIAWEGALQQVAARDAEVSKYQAEHQRMRALWQQATDAHSADVAALQTQLEGLKSRAEVNERLLAECRAELQARIDELRQEERRAQEAMAKIATLEQKQQSVDTANKDRVDRIAELERAQAKLLQRVKPMVKAIRTKDGEISGMRQQIESLQARIAAEAERFNADRERADEQIKTLTENYERERVLKALAEGALETDRKERAQLQQALKSARNAQSGGGFQPTVIGN